MSEEDLTNYKTYISDFDITKHIVLDNESNYWYSAEYVDKMLKKQDKEIERLKKREQECIDHYLVQCKYASEMETKYIIANNIINELEKEIDRLLERQYESERFAKEQGFDTYLPAKENLLCVKNKLQELKEGNKE